MSCTPRRSCPAAAQPRSASGSERFSALSAPSGSAEFVRAGGVGCLHRKQNNTAWYDPCQEYWRHENDRDAAKDYYASQLWGTGKSKSIWSLEGLEVFARRTPNTAVQEWVDWDPGSDADIKCQPQSVEVSYAGASVGITSSIARCGTSPSTRTYAPPTGGGVQRGGASGKRRWLH